MQDGGVARREVRPGWRRARRIRAPGRLELDQSRTIARTGQDVLRRGTLCDFLHLAFLSLSGLGGGCVSVVDGVRPPSTRASGFSVQIDRPPAALSRSIVLNLDEATVERQVVPHRILERNEYVYKINSCRHQNQQLQRNLHSKDTQMKCYRDPNTSHKLLPSQV